MYLNPKTILLGAALATAAPVPNGTLAHNGTFTNSTLPQQGTKSFPPAHWTVLDRSYEWTIREIIDYLDRDVFTNVTSEDTTGGYAVDGDGEVSEVIATDTSEGATGGYAVGCDGKVAYYNSIEEATASGGCQNDGDNKVFSRSVKGCNFKAYEKCKARGGEECGKELDKHGGCTIDEFHDYLLGKGHKNEKRPGGGDPADGDGEVSSTNVKACDFDLYDECKSRGGNQKDCVKEVMKHGECELEPWEIIAQDWIKEVHNILKRPVQKRPVGGNSTDGDADTFFDYVEGCDFKPYEECKSRGSNHDDCIKELIKHGKCNNSEILMKHLIHEATERVDGGWAVDGGGKVIYNNSTSSENATREYVNDDRYGEVVYSDDA